jgi:hypothetical protein
MVGWFAGVVLWPLKMLCPEWVVAMRYISAFGMAVALLAPPDMADRDGPSL